MPTQPRFTPEEIKAAVASGDLTPEIAAQMHPSDQAVYKSLLSSGPGGPSLGVSGNDTPGPSMFERVLHEPGLGESVGGMAGGLFGPVLGGLGGGLGDIVDQLRQGNMPDLGEVFGGAMNQALPLGAGKLMEMGAPKMLHLAMPGASERAVQGAMRGPGRAPGLKLGRVQKKLDQIGDQLGERGEQLDAKGYYGTRADMYKGNNELGNKMARQSMNEDEVHQTLADETAKAINQETGSNRLSPSDLVEKKTGARKGYEGIMRRANTNQTVAPPTELNMLEGKNAQAMVEGFDEDARAAGSIPKRSFGRKPVPVKDMNQRYGEVKDLENYLSNPHGSPVLSGFPMRFFMGTLGGATAQKGLEALQGGDDMGDKSYVSRYGPGGMIGGAAAGFAPAGSALALKSLGILGPKALQAYEAYLAMDRDRNKE